MAYTIGNGKIGTSNGTEEKVLLYNISIQKFVSFPYTCHQKKAQIYQITDESKNDKIETSIYFPLLSEWSIIDKNKMRKYQKKAQIKEKL